MSFFHLHFSSFVMSFQLTESPVTRAWRKTFVEGAELGDIQSVFLTKQLPERIKPKMTKAIEVVAKTFPEFEEAWAAGFSRDTMNRLHHLFHICYEDPARQAITRDDCRAALQTINLLSHEWDTYEKTLTGNKQHWASARLVDIDETTFEPIPTWMWKEWHFRYEYYGDLRLGYYTLGKSLFDAYLNNDVEVARNHLARPQQVIPNQFFVDMREQRYHYGGYQTEQVVHAEFRKWCAENGVDYADQPEHRAKMQPLLGRLVSKHNINDLEKAWSTETPTWSFTL